VKVAAAEPELAGVAVPAAVPVKSPVGDTELLAHVETVTEAEKVADAVAQAVPDTEGEGDREGLREKDSDGVPLLAPVNVAPVVAVKPMEALTVVDGNGQAVAVWLGVPEGPEEGVGGTVGVGRALLDSRVVPDSLPHALGEAVCVGDSVKELEGEDVMVPESVATAVPLAVPDGVMVPEVEATAVPVKRGEEVDETVGDAELPAVTLGLVEALPVIDTRMEGVTVMVEGGLRVDVEVTQPVAVTLGLEEEESKAEALSAEDAVAAEVAVTSEVRLSDGLGEVVGEGEADAETLVEEEAVPQEDPVPPLVAEKPAERVTGPVRVAEAEVVSVGAPEGVTAGVRVSISTMDAEAEADADIVAAAVSVWETVGLMLKEGVTDTDADAEGEGESVATAEPLLNAVAVGVWLSDSVPVTDTDVVPPTVSDPVEDGLLATVVDTDGELLAQ